jgi:hypothetical protein
LGSDQRSEAEIMARLTLIAAGAGAGADPAGVDEMIIGQFVGAATQMPGSPTRDRIRPSCGPPSKATAVPS